MFELGLRSCKGNMISKFMPPSIVLQGVVAIWDRVRVPSFTLTSGEENENCKLFGSGLDQKRLLPLSKKLKPTQSTSN
jgi:hypothetical protein